MYELSATGCPLQLSLLTSEKTHHTYQMKMELFDSPIANSILIAISLVILSFLLLLISYYKHVIVTSLPPGKLGWPIIGETREFNYLSRNGNLQGFMFQRMNRYSPKVFKTFLFLEKMAVICDAPGNKFIFSNENKLVKGWFPRSITKIAHPHCKTGAAYEEENSSRIKLMNQFLNPQTVHKYIEEMDYTTKHHMDSEWAPNSMITVHPVAKKLAFSLACRLFLGMDYASARVGKVERHYEIVGAGLLSVPIDLPGTAFRRAIKAAEFIRGEFLHVVRTKRLEASPSSPPENNYMSRLLTTTDEQGKLLTDWEIANIMMGTLIASHETTSSLLTNIVYHLADHPHVYALALKEQIEIKSLKGGETLLTWEDTKRMKYGLNIINEVLRITPPIYGAFRDVIHDFSYEGFTIPKGWKLICSAYSAHKNPEYFPNPEKFDPTRFDGKGPTPGSFIPFGGGPRICPGNEYSRQIALVFLHNLLVNFKWEKLIASEKIIHAPFSFPANGLPIKLQKRGDDAVVGSN